MAATPKSPVTKKVQIEMSHTKSTKNFERYDAADASTAVVSNLYIKLAALGDKAPDNIVVSVEPA